MHKAIFDKTLLNDWCNYCEGKQDFDTYHFSTLLMEAFLEGYTSELDSFLKEIAKYFHPSLYENMAHAFGNNKPDKADIQTWVAKDLKEKRKLLLQVEDATDLIALIDKDNYTIVHDMQEMDDARMSDNHTIFYEEVGDYVSDNIESIKGIYGLKEVLYNIASDYNLVHALLSGMIKGDTDFSNYIEIYRRGSNYVVGEESVLIYVFNG